jgi:hypothetical protein
MKPKGAGCEPHSMRGALCRSAYDVVVNGLWNATDGNENNSGVLFSRIDGVLCGQKISDLFLMPIHLIIITRNRKGL